MMWRIVQIEENVIGRGGSVGESRLRDQDNTADSTKAALRNLFIIFLSSWQAYLCIDLLRNYFSVRFQDINRCFSCRHRNTFCAYSCIYWRSVLVRNSGISSSDCRERHFLVHYRPSSLIFRQIYHRSTSFPSKYTIESMVYCSHLPNLVRVTKNKQEDLSQSETAKYFEWIMIATIGLTAIGIYILPNHKSFNLRRNCQKNSLYFGKQLHMYFASRYGLLKFFRLQCFKI